MPMNRKVYIYALALCCVGAVFLFFYYYDFESGTTTNNGNEASSLFRSFLIGKNEETRPRVSSTDNNLDPIIKSVSLVPERPTILDNIKASPALDREVTKAVTYEFKWLVNGSHLTDVNGDTLPAGRCRKKDLISVEATPIVDGRKGHPFISSYRVIHSTPPDLFLKEEYHKDRNVFEFQLIGEDPDGDTITYALEDPVPDGMTIDKNTGKIYWKPSKPAKGTCKFLASATDADGSKTTKTFQFNTDFK